MNRIGTIHSAAMLLAIALVANLRCVAPAASQQPDAAAVPIPQAQSKYLDAIESHLDYVTEHSLDQLGEKPTAMWLATIDIRTNGLPAEPLPGNLRWYRKITSPRGSNLYWDQPTVVAAYELSRRTGCACYEDAADAYLRDFLKLCVAQPSGLFEWGNHRYYDVVTDGIASFSGGFHECRPHTPAWETFWKIDEATTRRTILAMAAAHIKDPVTGRFCRHANPLAKPGVLTADEIDNAMPFLEAGAVLIDSISWLAAKTDPIDDELVDTALRVAHYSYAQRDPRTQLIRNQPVDRRWDYFASTTEVGLWAGCLLRAADRTGEEEFRVIAEASIQPWLRYGFDEAAGKYFGSLSVQSGKPAELPGPRGYTPPMYAEVFDIHERPSHNYPMPMAETCLSLYQSTEDDSYAKAVDRWVQHIRVSLPANESKGAYAEDYGRAIHFLVRAADVLQRPEYRRLAQRVADEAMGQLFVPKMGMFRSHPGEDRCDAVDGPGILLLALMYLDGGDLPETAFAF